MTLKCLTTTMTLVLGLSLAACTPNETKLAPAAAPPAPTAAKPPPRSTPADEAVVERKVQAIPIPRAFRECKKDEDCQITTSLCGCCNFVPMAQSFVSKYQALKKYCEVEPPLCKCAAPTQEARCRQNLCDIVE